MIFTVHGGHNRKAPGTSYLLDEVTEDRKIKDLVISKLKSLGHTVYDCTDDEGASKSTCLANIAKKCNSHVDADLNISIHLNSCVNDLEGDGTTTGTEVWVYKKGNTASSYAERVCEAISELGYRNRGVKASTGLYILRHTKKPTILIECCFLDDADDVRIYNAEAMATAIVKGITGQVVGFTEHHDTASSSSGYLVKVTASTLNVRSDASASSAITVKVHNGEVYTIVEEKMNGSTPWGKLKSGAGWICLNYVKRI